MQYDYLAFDQNGQRMEGRLKVPSETVAEEVLWGQGLTVVQLAPVRSRPTLYTLFPSFFGVKRRDLIVFSQQLATLLGSGIDIIRALQLLEGQSSRRALRATLQEVIISLQQGQPLAAALKAHSHTFSPLYVSTMAVGERTGNAEEVLRQMADYLEKEEALARKLTGAMAYPAFVLLVAVGVVVLMLTVAIPPMVDLITSFGGELPLPTRILIALSDFMTTYGLYLLIGGLTLAGVTGWWSSQPAGRRVRDGIVLRIPMVGKISLQGQIARFSRTASVLMCAGLPLTEVMELVLQTIGNVLVAAALERAYAALLTGQGLSPPLVAERILPPLLAQMVHVGEETGTLEGNLATLASFYEEEVARNTETLTSLAEPALTIFIGTVVAFIAIAMVSPMYSLMGEIK